MGSKKSASNTSLIPLPLSAAMAQAADALGIEHMTPKASFEERMTTLHAWRPLMRLQQAGEIVRIETDVQSGRTSFKILMKFSASEQAPIEALRQSLEKSLDAPVTIMEIATCASSRDFSSPHSA
jgi:hypothetical protein